MKIKNFKNIFGGILFFLILCGSFVHGQCTDDMSAGIREDFPGNLEQSGQCRSNTSNQNSNQWYNNKNPLPGEANLFLKMIDKSWVECSASNVAQIQRAMQTYGCSTCIDGRAGNHMRSVITQCDLTLFCVAPKKLPTLNGNNELICSDSGYILEGKCCVEENPTPTQIEQCQPGTPSITNWNPNRNDNKALIVVQYPQKSGCIFDHWDENAQITIRTDNQVANGVSFGYDSNELKLLLNVPVTDSTQVITISVGNGVIMFSGGVQSPLGMASFNRSSCQNPPDGIENESCESYGWNWRLEDHCCIENPCEKVPDQNGECSIHGPTYFFDDTDGCCVMDTGGSCNNPPENGQCGSGFILQNDCCINGSSCSSGYYDNNLTCQPCTGDTMPNERHTRCICNPDLKCCGVQLNTVVPFIGDCIEMNAESNRDNTTNVNSVTAFPILMQGLMKILMSVIMIFSFLMVIIAGLMIVSGAFGGNGFATGKKIIKNVIISLILLGCSGLILSLINPSFFGG